mgnify:CR=1 FL=1
MMTHGSWRAVLLGVALSVLVVPGSGRLQAATNITGRSIEELQVIGRTHDRLTQEPLIDKLLKGPVAPERIVATMIENRLLGPEYGRVFLCAVGSCQHLPAGAKPVLSEQLARFRPSRDEFHTCAALLRVLALATEDGDFARSLLPMVAELVRAGGSAGVQQTVFYAAWYVRVSHDVDGANRLLGQYVPGDAAAPYLNECCTLEGDFNKVFEYERCLGVPPGTKAGPDRVYAELGGLLRMKTNLTDESRARILKRQARHASPSITTNRSTGRTPAMQYLDQDTAAKLARFMQEEIAGLHAPYDTGTIPVMQQFAEDADAKLRKYVLGELAGTHALVEHRQRSAEIFAQVLKNSRDAEEKSAAVAFLREMLDSPQAIVAGAALLGAVGDPDVMKLPELGRGPFTTPTAVLAAIARRDGTAALPPGTGGKSTFEVLGRIRSPSLVPGVAAVLWEALRHEDDTVSLAAATWLQARADEFMPTVGARLQSEDAYVVATACDLLTRARPVPTNAVALLSQLAGSSNWLSRLCAVNALGEVGRGSPISAPVLSAATGDSVPQVQTAARRALKRIGGEAAVLPRSEPAGRPAGEAKMDSVPARTTEASSERESVAVLDFVDTHGLQSDEGAKLSALVFAELSAVPGISLVERSEIDRVLSERGLTAEGFVDSAAAIDLGHMLSADRLVLGRIYEVDGTIWCNCRLRDCGSGGLTGCVVKIGRHEDMDAALPGLAAKIARMVTVAVSGSGRAGRAGPL